MTSVTQAISGNPRIECVPPPTPSLGELLQEGKNNLDAWWISISAFSALVITLLLLTFMGDALRNALDTRMRGSAFGGGK